MLKMELNKTFKLAGLQWTVLDQLEDGFLCIAESIGNREFGKNNDWKESDIRKYLNSEFLEMLVKEIGEDAIQEFERNLLSHDGQKEYGTCMDKISMITVDEYRKYRELLPNTGKWWWTITPDSTPCNNDNRWMIVVSPSGGICCNDYDDFGGVRPLCILKSNIFES